MRDGTSEVLKVAARLEQCADAATVIAATAKPGSDRQGWSEVAQDFADMAGTFRAAVLIDNPDVTESTA